MLAKRKSDGKVIEVKEWRGASDVIYSELDMNAFYQASDLDFSVNETKEAEGEVISGWGARDWNGSLYLYCHKPERNFAKSLWEGEIMNITPSDDMFPDIMWFDEPMEVEITIKPKKKS